MNSPSELYACLYAREFPAQAMLRLRPGLRDKAFVVMEGEPPFETVCSFNSKARKVGISVNMTRVELDTFPSVVVLSRSREEETIAKAAALECAGSYSPRVEDRSDGRAFLCVIDITGTESLFGPPKTLAENLLCRVKTLGISASVTVSSNFLTAVCHVRGISSSTGVSVIAPGDECAALAPLPLTILPLCQQKTEIFAMWGIRTVGMLAALPEKELIARMGQEGKYLRQLARGEVSHLFVPVEPSFQLEERMELDAPLEVLDSLLFAAGVMLEQLIIRATARVLALASVTITLLLDDGTAHTRTVRSALPTNDRLLWIKLLHLDLEAHPPQASILSLKLTAEAGSISKTQLGLFSPQLPEPILLDVTLARIRAIVGDECVGHPVLKNTHQPDAFKMEPFSVPDQAASATTSSRPTTVMRLLRPAESAAVTLRDQRPVSFIFREKQYQVEHFYGPWLACGDWWNETLWSSEQWDLVARTHDEMLLCCCMVRDLTLKGWQMVALYD